MHLAPTPSSKHQDINRVYFFEASPEPDAYGGGGMLFLGFGTALPFQNPIYTVPPSTHWKGGWQKHTLYLWKLKFGVNHVFLLDKFHSVFHLTTKKS